jgi:dolichyl-phosphate beta-glucosyltransferase
VLSIIIPAFNEESRLPPYLFSIVAYLESRGGPSEIIVVDDGSRDGTVEAVLALTTGHPSLRLIPLDSNKGKGFAVRTGMLAAKGDLRLFCDADGATPIEELHRLERALSSDIDIVIGSRAIRHIECRVEGTLHRKYIGFIYNRLVRLLAVRGLYDTQCGFKLFRGAAADRLFAAQTLAGFGFDAEVLFLARKWGTRFGRFQSTGRISLEERCACFGVGSDALRSGQAATILACRRVPHVPETGGVAADPYRADGTDLPARATVRLHR